MNGRVLGAIISASLMVVSIAAAAQSEAAKQQVKAATCTVRAGARGLIDVQCPNATVGELLLALRRAVGLRAEYPDQFATAKVSVTLRRVQLHEALRSAFAEFNFATWEDPKSPAVTWLKLVGLRRTVEGSQQAQAHANQEAPVTHPEVTSTVARAPTTTAFTPPPQDPVEMARIRQGFSNSVTTPSAPPVLPPQDRTEMARVRDEFAKQVIQVNPQTLAQSAH